MKAVKIWVLIVFLFIPAINVHAWPIPDTGQTKCYNNTVEITCPAVGEPFYGQDGSYTINTPSYTKLGISGEVLPNDTTSWAMIRDNVTGLIWENKTSDGTIHDGTKTFTWCDTNPATNGGNQGTCGSGTGNAATDTEAYIKCLNDANFGGFSDWRMPTPQALATVEDLSRIAPTINNAWFPNTLSIYWSSSTDAGSVGNAWCVEFYGGSIGRHYDKANAIGVRAVRGGQPELFDHLVDNGDGTVTDTATGLMWQQGTVSGKNWQAALEYAEGLSLAGYDDWRLPTKTELHTIVDFSRYNPAIDTTFFPGTLSLSYYWSSTTLADPNANNGAWNVYFNYGSVYGLQKPAAYSVRAVRGGQSGLFASLVISKSGSGTVSSVPSGINCGSQCTAFFNAGTSVTLTAQAASGSTFAGWSGGGCAGVSACTLILNADTTVAADFSPLPLSLISPSNSSTVSDSTLMFSWNPIANAVSYELIVDNNTGLGSPEIHEPGNLLQNLTETQLTVTNHLPDNVYSWKVIAHLADGSTSESAVGTFTYHLPVHPDPVWVPLYRLYNATIKDHYYTTIPAHRDQARSSKGYTYERIEGYISDRKFNDANCGYLFHLEDKTNSIHFYTSSDSEKDDKIIHGFSYEGIVGFLYTQPFTWGAPLHRLYNAANTDYFYTISRYERDWAISKFQFAQDGSIVDEESTETVKPTIVGYVSPIGIMNPDSRLKFNAFDGFGTNTGNGDFTYRQTDLAIAGIIPVTLGRTYNSLNRGVDGPLGYGWTHSYQARLLDDGKRVYVFWPDGHADYYERGGGNMTFNNPAKATNPGCYDTLFIEKPNSDTLYTITKKDQSQYVFKIPESDRGGATDPKAPYDVAQFRSIIDKNGNAIALWYDASGYLYRIQDAGNRFVEIAYFAEVDGHTGHIKTITDTIGRNIQFQYDSNDNLISVTDPRGNATQFAYDTNHQLTQVTLPELQVLKNAYENFKVKNQTIGDVANGRTYDFAYIDTQTTVTNPTLNGERKGTKYTISNSQLQQIVDPMTFGSVFEFSDLDNPTRPTKVTNPRGKVTEFSYDKGTNDAGKKLIRRGNLLTMKDPYLKMTQYTYDEKNNLLTVTDPRSYTTMFAYDADKRNLLSVSRPMGGVTEYTYYGNGLIHTVKDPNNHTLTYAYDTSGNMTSLTDGFLGTQMEMTYDGVGRLLTRKAATGRITQYVYDPNNNLTHIIDANSKTSTYAHDRNNKLTSLTDPRDSVTVFAYNSENMLASETDPIQKTYQYTYDLKGNLSRVLDPDQHETTFTYDQNSRLSDLEYDNITKISFTYDENGNTKTMSDDSGTTAFTYDDLNRLGSYTNGYSKTVSYGYDEAGNLERITYPGSKQVVYAYDGDNRLMQVTDWLGDGTTTYTYDPVGLLKSVTNPNGTKTTYTYDAANRLTGLANKKSSDAGISDYLHTLNNIGVPTQIVKNEPLTPPRPAANVTYTYDNANRIQAVGNTSFSHDNRGNLTGTNTGSAYQFDFANRLIQIDIGGTTTQYIYDGFGNRISKTKGGTQTKYVLDLSGNMNQVLAETDATGNIDNYYVYGHGLISKITSAGSRYLYHYDHLGNTVAVTDANENITEKYAYDEFGQVLAADPATVSNPFRYVGKYGVMDEGNGLLFMRARYYDTALGRFISKDPIGFEGGDLNLYAYVGGNPVTGVDPAGTIIQVICGAAAVIDALKTAAMTQIILDEYRYHLEKSLWYSDKIYQLELKGKQNSRAYKMAKENAMYELMQMEKIGEKIGKDVIVGIVKKVADKLSCGVGTLFGAIYDAGEIISKP